MTKCQLKQGFFFLRDCENEATITCPICKRQVCEQHSKLMPGKNKAYCLDCIGKDIQNRRKKNMGWASQWYGDEYFDPNWAYSSRGLFYRSLGYSPWYMGNNYKQVNKDKVYNAYDIRAFDARRIHSDDDFDNDPHDWKAEADVFDS